MQKIFDALAELTKSERRFHILQIKAHFIPKKRDIYLKKSLFAII